MSLWREENQKDPEKNSWSVDENQLHVQIIQTQPTVMPDPGIEPGSQWW